MNKKIALGILVAIIIIGGGAFYGGIKYAQTHNPSFGRDTGNAANIAFGMRGGRMSGGTSSASGGFTTGEVIAKDDKSITIKLRDSGSKIVFLAGTTQVMKTVVGSSADITIGTQISTTGVANSDGSVTAKSIQIRPAVLSNDQ